MQNLRGGTVSYWLYIIGFIVARFLLSPNHILHESTFSKCTCKRRHLQMWLSHLAFLAWGHVGGSATLRIHASTWVSVTGAWPDLFEEISSVYNLVTRSMPRWFVMSMIHDIAWQCIHDLSSSHVFHNNWNKNQLGHIGTLAVSSKPKNHGGAQYQLGCAKAFFARLRAAASVTLLYFLNTTNCSYNWLGVKPSIIPRCTSVLRYKPSGLV